MRTTRPARTRTGIAAVTLACAILLALAPLTGCEHTPVYQGTLANPGPKAAQQTSQAIQAEKPSSIPTMAGVVTPPAHGAYIGLFRPPAPYEMTALDSYTASLSPKVPSILMWYQAWATDQPREFDQAAAVVAYQRGCIPMVTWEPWDPTAPNAQKNPDYRLQAILDGRYDPYIHRFAHKIKDVRGPVMLRPMHEMNGYWYPWSGFVNDNTPAKFISAWKHMHDIFKAEGATNVTWVWTVNWNSVPNSYTNRYAAYYPGDAWVDWVGISGFNWGTVRRGSSWMTFDQIYDAPLAYLRTLNKPIAVAEMACVEQGGDKAAWITDTYATIRTQHPEIKAVIWFDSREEGNGQVQDWRIATSRKSKLAYRSAVADPYYLAGPAEPLSNWLGAQTVKDWAYLRALPAVY